MKQTLIDKYLAGETTVKEEDELKRLLQETPSEQLSSTEKAVLSLLGQDPNTEEEDIFSVDHSDEFDRIMAAKHKETVITAEEETKDEVVTVELKPKIALWKTMTSIAASIAIILGTFTIWNNGSEEEHKTIAKVTIPTKVNNSNQDKQEDTTKEEPTEENINSLKHDDSKSDIVNTPEQPIKHESKSEEVIDIYDLVAESDSYDDADMEIRLLDIDLAQASSQADDIRSTLYAINNELFLLEE